MNARPQPTEAYSAAGNGRRLRYFPAVSFGPNAVLEKNATLLARTRATYREDPWATALRDKSVANAIGTGIMARPLWGTKAQKAEQRKLWNQWIKRSDADGVLDFYGQQALGWAAWKEAGEVFFRLRNRRPEDGLPVPLQLQVIESEQCPAHYHGYASNGNRIRHGIELDAIGRRRAYWMYREHPGDRSGAVNASELVRVPAEQVIHLYRPLRPGQLRGVPPSAASLVMMLDKRQLTDAKLQNFKLNNLFCLFYTTPVGGDEPLGGGGPLDEAVVDEDDDGAPIAGLEPGTAQELPPGVKPEFSDPPTPGADYAEYNRSLLIEIAASHGIPYEVLTGDLRDVSDRALRLILNEFRRSIEMDQWLYAIPMLCQRVREAWFDQAVLAGKLRIPNYTEIRADVVETTWVPQGWPYSHPVQDVDADIKAIRAGLSSRTRTNMTNGEDSEEIDAEQVEDNRRSDLMELRYDSDGRQQKAATPAAQRPQENQEVENEQ
jgi:lambda family phage portal protein